MSKRYNLLFCFQRSYITNLYSKCLQLLRCGVQPKSMEHATNEVVLVSYEGLDLIFNEVLNVSHPNTLNDQYT